MHFGTDELVQIKLAMLDRAKLFYRLAYSVNAKGHGQDFLDNASSVQSTIDYIDRELHRRG